MWCRLDDLRAFGNQWTTAARDERHDAGRRNKMPNISWRNGLLQRKPGLDYGMQSYSMPELDGKDQEEDSPKQAGSCWFARPC